jgi:4-hydroxybenzoate polyprenyltransferase
LAAALRILVDVLAYRLRRLEMANLAGAVAIMLALRLPTEDVAIRTGYGLLLNLFAYLVNDYYDVDRDLAGGRDPEKTRFLREHMSAAFGALVALAVVLVAVALLYEPELLVAAVLGGGVCWAYSAQLQGVPLSDVAAMTLWGAAMPLVGVPFDEPVGWALVAELALFSTCFESIQVVRDRDEDAEAGVETTAVRFGRAQTLVFARFAMLGAALYAALVLHRFLGAGLLLALLLPTRAVRADGAATAAQAASRYWNAVRIVFGLVWLGILAWVWSTGSTDGWLVRLAARSAP